MEISGIQLDAPAIAVDVALAPTYMTSNVIAHAHTTYVVVDVVRATTTLSVLFERGCARVLIAPSITAGREAKRALGSAWLLAGEIGGIRPNGYDYGNSPSELAQIDLSGREVIFATTNGTRALRACTGGRLVLAGSLRNASAVAAAALAGVTPSPADSVASRYAETDPPTQLDASSQDASEDRLPGALVPGIVIVCAGREGRPAYDDTLCAGWIVHALQQQAASRPIVLGEGARIAQATADAVGASSGVSALESALRASDAGQAVVRIGLAADLALCAAADTSRLVPAVVGTYPDTDLYIMDLLR